jgi:hypothetical protein
MSTTTPRGMTPKADRTGPMKAATLGVSDFAQVKAQGL